MDSRAKNKPKPIIVVNDTDLNDALSVIGIAQPNIYQIIGLIHQIEAQKFLADEIGISVTQEKDGNKKASLQIELKRSIHVLLHYKTKLKDVLITTDAFRKMHFSELTWNKKEETEASYLYVLIAKNLLEKSCIDINVEAETMALSAIVNYCTAELYYEYHEKDNALPLYKIALENLQKLKQDEGREAILVMKRMASIFLEQGKLSKAMRYNQLSLKNALVLYGENNKFVINLITNIAAIYGLQGKHHEALDLYEKALAAVKKSSGNKASQKIIIFYNNIGNINSALGRYEQAITNYQETLAIIGHSSVPKNPLEEARILISIAVVYQKWGKKNNQGQIACKEALEKIKNIGNEAINDKAHLHYLMAKFYDKNGDKKNALESYKSALAFMSKSRDKNPPLLYALHKAFADYLIKTGETKIANEASDYLKDAIKYYELAFKQHIADIKASNKKLTYYDLGTYTKLLAKLANAYRKSGNLEKAAELYHKEAISCQETFPMLSLQFSKYALRDYARVPAQKENRSALYFSEATIHHQNNQLGLALRALKKAFVINPQNKEYQNKYKVWKEEHRVALSILDTDIYAQLERCKDIYFNLLKTCTEDLTTHDELSDQAKILSTELIIKLRNILDQSYGRFVNTCLYQANDEGQAPDVVFPYSSSKGALVHFWQKNDILNTGVSFSKKHLNLSEWETKPFNTIISELIRLNLIKNDQFDKKQFLKDPKLTALAPEFSPYKIEIIKLLRKLNDGDILKKSTLGTLLNTHQVTLAQKKFPTTEAIIGRLISHGWIQLKSGKTEVWELTDACRPGNPIFDASLNAACNFPNDNGTPCNIGNIINVWLKRKITSPKRSLDTNYTNIFNAIIEEQPFSYFSTAANSTDNGHWLLSWLDKVREIANDSKHIRLTPQRATGELEEIRGTLDRRSVEINIDLMETRPVFYGWSFVFLLNTCNPDFTDAQLIELSQQIRTMLNANGYIKRGAHTDDAHIETDDIVLPEIKEIFELYKKGESNAKIDACKVRLQQTLERDLPAEVKPYSVAIGDFLIRRKLQQVHLSSEPDYTIELIPFLNQAMKKTESLAYSFGKACHQRQVELNKQTNSAPFSDYDMAEKVVDPIKTKRTNISDIKSIENSLKPSIKLFSKPDITPAELKNAHVAIKKLAAAHRVNKNLHYTGHLFLKAANDLATSHPWLAIRYYKKAARELMATYPTPPELITCYTSASNIYKQLGLKRLAKIQLKKAFRASHKKDMVIKKEIAALDAALKAQEDSQDSDIYSQLEYVKSSVLSLNYLSFKLFNHEQDDHLNLAIQNGYVELTIKVRHLLDQALGRFANRKINLPNDSFKSDVHFPATSSVAELIDLLKKANLTQNPADKLSLERDFGPLFALIEATQPFAPGQRLVGYLSWIELLIIISNQGKHESLSRTTAEQLEAWWNRPNLSATSLYPLFYSEKSLEPSSFSNALSSKGDLAGSTLLHDELKRKQIIREKTIHPYIEAYVIAMHRGENPVQSELIDQLKLKKLKFIVDNKYDKNDVVLNAILNVLLNHAEKKLGYSQRFSQGAVTDINLLLQTTLESTSMLFTALLDPIVIPAPAAPASSIAPTAAASLSPQISRRVSSIWQTSSSPLSSSNRSSAHTPSTQKQPSSKVKK